MTVDASLPERRAWNTLLGPPSAPLTFPRPPFSRGRRDSVRCYIPVTGEWDVLENVLFRDFDRGGAATGVGAAHIRQAFWPIRYKPQVETTLGHVE
jgi:hypothetical protein